MFDVIIFDENCHKCVLALVAARHNGCLTELTFIDPATGEIIPGSTRPVDWVLHDMVSWYDRGVR